jgi:N-acetylglucosaminyldiphosphoundecaprenol N-acetyl-beta-D-mannosaminyltransferase
LEEKQLAAVEPLKRKNILGVGIHPLTLNETVDLIGDWIASGNHCTHQVVTINPEMLYRAQDDAVFRDLLNKADLVVPDGHGVVWAGNYLGEPFPERVTGIDLVWALAERGEQEGWRFYFIGAERGVAEAAAARMCRRFPRLIVAGTEHGYFSAEELDAVLGRIRAAHPDLLLVGLGSPKQEFFIRAHQKELNAQVAVGVGGSFDVLSGRLKRAPEFIQRLHLEWLFRAFQEPGRWRRLLVLPRYVLLVLKESFRKKHDL